MNMNSIPNIKDLTQHIPFKWRVQSFSKSSTKCSCVAYIDARDAMDLLDKVVGPENWQDKYDFVGNRIIAGIGIKCGGEWIWKYDTGTESNMEGEKGQFSDAFKRAGVKWGIGRFLYDMEIQWLDSNEKKTQNNYPHAVDKSGKRIRDVTEYINNQKKNASTSPPVAAKSPQKSEEQTHTEALRTLKEIMARKGKSDDRPILDFYGVEFLGQLDVDQLDVVIRDMRKFPDIDLATEVENGLKKKVQV